MRHPGARLWFLTAMVLASLTVSACAAGSTAATPTPLPLPTATEEPTATATATRTPTRTRTPTPTVSPAAALLQQVRGKQTDLKSYRGQLEIVMDVVERGLPQSITMAVDIEVAEPDMHMKMVTEGIPVGFDMEIIAKDNTMYMNMGGEWMAMPGSVDSATKSQMDPINAAELDKYLADASNPQLAGRREVEGVECDAVTFSMPWEKALALAQMGGSTSGQDLSQSDMQFDQFTGELAIGVEDKLVRQMAFKMNGYNKAKPAERFSMDFGITIWDINAEDIVIKAPEGVEIPPASTPRPRLTPTPRA